MIRSTVDGRTTTADREDEMTVSVDTTLETALRSAMANFATGLTVVTTSDGGRPHGSTLSGVMSLSMDPPMVLLSLARTSSLLARLHRGGRFGVNVLAAHQDQVALRFATKVHDRFADVGWSDEGAPGSTTCTPGCWPTSPRPPLRATTSW